MTGDTLKKSILQLAVTGKLVSQNSKDEPASKLLEKINKERDKLIKEGKSKKQKFESIQEDEIPFEIPKSWCWCRLNFCVINISAKNYQIKQTEILSKGKYPVISQSINLIEGYSNLSNKLLKHINPIIVFGDHNKSLKFIDFNFVVGADGTKLLYPIYENFKYIYYAIQYFIYKIKNRDYGRHYQFIEKIPIPLPPLAEQDRIVKKLEQILPLVEEYGKNEEKLSELNKSLPDKLKQSILQYAVQGKLVKQNSNDEPAIKLLERIKAEKEKLIKEGKIKKDKNQSYIFRRDNSHYEKIGNTEHCIDSEIPFDIPKSWQWVRLKSICIINPKYNAEDDIDAGFIPMTLINDGYNGGHTFQIKKWKFIKNGFTHFANGDLVIAKITPCFENRKSTIIKNLPNNIGAGTTELHVIKNYAAELNLNYLLLIVKTADFISKGIKSFTGTAGQQRISKNYIEQYLVPLPPIQEQKRIVEKVKEIFSFLQ